MLTLGLRTLEPTVYPAPVIHGRYHLLTNRKIQGPISSRRRARHYMIAPVSFDPLRTVDRRLKRSVSLFPPAESPCAQYSKTSLMVESEEVDFHKALTYPSACSKN
jgi:hypothetical protein